MRDAEREFTELVAARWTALVRAAALLGCAPADAEDVAQAALTRCYEQWDRVRRAESRDAYVHRVLVNTFIDRTRRRSHAERPTQLDRGDGRVRADDLDVRMDIEAALGRLSRDQRITVVLRYYLDLSEKEAAAALGVPPGTVKSRLARGLAALSTHLAEPSAEGGAS